jgi:alpha-tubulin suppressor-like RCC1 family protein
MKFRILIFLCLFLSPSSVLYAADKDGDGVQNENDNCPGVPNADQSDDNQDDIGDDCPESISGGRGFFCATLNGGKIKCWGNNEYGQIGNWSTIDTDLPSTILMFTPFKKAFISDYTTCSAVNTSNDDDRGYCWGRANNYVFNQTSHYESPHLFSSLHHVRVIKSSNFRNCAIAAGEEVFCWGLNDYRQTGEPISGEYEEDAFTSNPFQVSNVNNAQSLVLGESHTCAVANGDKVVCWGNNQDGRLGLGTSGGSEPPTQIPGLSNVSYLTGEDFTTCAVMADHSLKCWGWTPLGYRHSPTTIAAWDDAKEVLYEEAGGWCFVRRNGTAACTGQTAVSMPSWTDIKDIALGFYMTACALREDGSVWCWGLNNWGQLGRGFKSNTLNIPPGKVHF